MTGATDLDSNPRIRSARVDMGAFESAYWGMYSDVDADGMRDVDEINADTDPTNSDSVLAVTGIRSDGQSVRVVWKGGREAWQYLEKRGDLEETQAVWRAVCTNLPPTPITTNFLDAGSSSQQFYRVRVQR